VCCEINGDGGVAFSLVERLGAIGADCVLCCVDMPIGLAERGVRAADVAAKRVLGRWNARVFLTPARGVFACADYPAANALSRELTGMGLSKQMWHIMPKIREVDDALRDDPRLRGVMRECHPEICFWGLGGGVVGVNKKTPEGFAARLAVLERFVPGAADRVSDALRALPKGAAQADDVVDALVCAVTAAGVWDGSLRTLPESPERDGCGLAMEMVYRDGATAGASVRGPVP
jgi:predicted RNase H-like nuclease